MISHTDFLQVFRLDGGSYEIAKGDIRNRVIVENVELSQEVDEEIYFGPAQRMQSYVGSKAGTGKAGILGTRVLWVDVDRPQLPQCTLPPSIIISSGHGWHFYWILKEPLLQPALIEAYNKILIEDTLGADIAAYNCDRLLRVPGSLNKKYDEWKRVTIKSTVPVKYELRDFDTLKVLNRKTRHKIRMGDRRGYKSRSERDWAVVTALVAAGATDRLITLLYQHQPVGDKFRDPETNTSYLAHTIAQAREVGEQAPVSGLEFGILEKDNGYYFSNGKRVFRISTFTLTPEMLLDGSLFEAQDALVTTVSANGHSWSRVVFPRDAFNSVKSLDKECPVMAWQWLGNDQQVRMLLPYLLDQLLANSLPKTAATEVLGLHNFKGRWYFVGTDKVLSADQIWQGYEGPLAWLPHRREHPETDLATVVNDEVKQAAAGVVGFNDPGVMWPMLGWYTSAILKPWLETVNYRFPILSVTGPRGSGKTTLIKSVLMPLFGISTDKTYDAGTTRFVRLALMGSSNAVPIAFSEFRVAQVADFLRYVLLSYDTGHDPRGRADQTTVDYALSAPFSLDGEDVLSDPAAKERVVVARLSSATVAEGSSAYIQFKQWQQLDNVSIGSGLIQYLLSKLEEGVLSDLLLEARKQILEAFPMPMPDRVRNNHTVCLFGSYLFCDYLGIPRPKANTMRQSIEAVFNIEAGRGRLQADDMIEQVINTVAGNRARFKWFLDNDGLDLYFQLSTAHPWWVGSSRSRGETVLEREAIRHQLKELDYVIDAKVIDGVYMYGVNLELAQQSGLDVPNKINSAKITVEVTL